MSAATDSRMLAAPASTVHIVGTGAYLPGDPITNADVEKFAGPLPEDVLSGLQVVNRHWLADPRTGAHSTSTSEMAERAARAALADAGLEPTDVDLLITSTSSPDYLLPPMATFVQERLGLVRCATLEIRSGCAGAVEALDVARLYLQQGRFRTAVVIGAEAISPLLVPIYRGRPAASVRMRDRIGLYTFGDGAGAIVLRAEHAPGDGVLPGAVACVGGISKPGMQIIGGGTHAPVHEQLSARRTYDLRIDVVESARRTPAVLAEAVHAVLEAAGVKAETIDLCIVPEGNAGYLAEELQRAGLMTAQWRDLQPKLFENLAEVGATGSAAVPLALNAANRCGLLRPGDQVMLLAIETSKWKYAGSVARWVKPVARA